jgi:V/A-type H+-transporting ATPase subunit I
MTIAVFKKVSIFGLHKNKAEIMSQLQFLGCMHLVSIRVKKPAGLTSTSTTLTDEIKKALYYLKNSPDKASIKKIYRDFNAQKIVSDISNNQEQLRKALDRRDFLQIRIKDLSIWGNFALPKEGEIGDIKLWFYKIRNKDIPAIPDDHVIHEVHRDNLFVYLIVLSKDEPPACAMPVPRIHTGAIPLADLKQELNEITERIDDLNEERRQLTRYYHLLSRELDRFTDLTNLQLANEKLCDHDDFFQIQGWVPEDRLKEIAVFCQQNGMAILVEPASAEERPPTLMQTYAWSGAGIELVNFYQTPGYRALDPSLMIFFSFSLFFAMILADAGYGFVIALFTLFAWKWMGKMNAGSWLRPLLVTISIFSIIYGVMLGSYFGVEPSSNSILGKIKILDINNFKTMMSLVIVIGCLHIVAANGMRAWFAKGLYEKVHAAGYIILILGFMALAWGLGQHSDTVITSSIAVICIGILVLLIFASDLPVTNFSSFLTRTLAGLQSISELTSLFGDILSYLRLFALGLAGASLAITFNQIARHISESTLHGHGWVLGFLVLLIGQSLNFILCVMSGVIHGLRLNYIEFFKWSIKEDGYVYAPLKKVEVTHE